MLNKLMNLRKKKGFTLIELIVVLVIMAILAAAAIPTVMGYIENSRKAAYLANVRAVYQAGQSAIAEGKAAGIAIQLISGKKDFYLEEENSTDASKTMTFTKRVAALTGFPEANIEVYLQGSDNDGGFEAAAATGHAKDTYDVLVDSSKGEILKIRGFYQNGKDKYVEFVPGGDNNVMDSANSAG